MSQMTDKEKIRKEVERLMVELTQEKKKGYSSDVDDACILELQNVLTYIDSLQEEKKPIRKYVSPEDSTLGKLLKEMKDFSPQEDLGLSNEEYNDFVNELIFGKEESVSNDLEKAAGNYAFTMSGEDEVLKYKAFKAGAQWQKEQMMKDAVEREVKVDAGGYPYIDATELYDYD